jgi:hypothetical protein
MTDATVSTASAPLTVVVDIEATVKAEVAKALAAAKAEESALVAKVKAFVAAHYSKVIAAAAGYGASSFDVLSLIKKFL